jgi:hypothetical protein
LHELNVPAMQYVPGKFLPVPNALSRRWDMEQAAHAEEATYLEDCYRRRHHGTSGDNGGREGRPPGWVDPSESAPGGPAAIEPVGCTAHSTPVDAAVRLRSPSMDGLEGVAAVRKREASAVLLGPESAVGEDPHQQGGLIRLPEPASLRAVSSVGCPGPAPPPKTIMDELPGRDRQNWTVRSPLFTRWHKQCKFTVDACAGKGGDNAQLARY